MQNHWKVDDFDILFVLNSRMQESTWKTANVHAFDLLHEFTITTVKQIIYHKKVVWTVVREKYLHCAILGLNVKTGLPNIPWIWFRHNTKTIWWLHRIDDNFGFAVPLEIGICNVLKFMTVTQSNVLINKMHLKTNKLM